MKITIIFLHGDMFCTNVLTKLQILGSSFHIHHSDIYYRNYVVLLLLLLLLQNHSIGDKVAQMQSSSQKKMNLNM